MDNSSSHVVKITYILYLVISEVLSKVIKLHVRGTINKNTISKYSEVSNNKDNNLSLTYTKGASSNRNVVSRGDSLIEGVTLYVVKASNEVIPNSIVEFLVLLTRLSKSNLFKR